MEAAGLGAWRILWELQQSGARVTGEAQSMGRGPGGTIEGVINGDVLSISITGGSMTPPTFRRRALEPADSVKSASWRTEPIVYLLGAVFEPRLDSPVEPRAIVQQVRLGE